MELLSRIRRHIQWYRRPLAALLAGLGALLLASALLPGTASGSRVVMTSRAVPAGASFTAADVHVVEVPDDALPRGELPSLAEVTGRISAGNLLPNSILQIGDLLAMDSVPDGRAWVPITVPDPGLLAVLAPGTLVSLVTADESGTHVLTDEAVITQLPAAPTTSGTLSTATMSRSSLVLVDVPSPLAAQIAVLGQQGFLSVILGAA